MTESLSVRHTRLVTQLRTRRKNLGLSQREVAEQMGTSAKEVSVWETGGATLRLSTFLKWVAVLDCEVEVNAMRARLH